MNKKITSLLIAAIGLTQAHAQTNIFPASGNAGVGTITPATTFQVVGTSRFGGAANYAQVNNSGTLSFQGSGGYYVGGNKYAFQFSGNPAYGLFFNSTLVQYEFRDGNARPVFKVNADLGDGTFLGGVKMGNSASTIAGNMRWTGTDFEGYNGSNWLSFTKKGWLLNGNAGTNPATDFIGTTDLQPLVFKINNIRAGYLGAAGITSFGYKALSANTTGLRNTAFGISTLEKNTISHDNSAFGDSALYNSGNAVPDPVFGTGNTAIGSKVLVSNSLGSYNTAIGFASNYNSVTGSENVSLGAYSSYSNIKGYNNIAIGYKALYSDTFPLYNIAIGYEALYNNNSVLGNIGIGYHALYYNIDGFGNTATGDHALGVNTSGYANTAMGEGSLYHNTTGYYNTAVGGTSGPSTGALFNTSCLGFGSIATASNQVRIGDNTVTSIGGYKAWTNLSDGRVKKNIKANVPGLAFINLLTPVTYNLDLDAADRIIAKAPVADKDGKVKPLSADQVNSRKAQEKILCTGFVAQEVEAAAKKIGYDFEGVDAPKNDKDMYGLRYSEFVVPLVKAVQELSQSNDALKKENDVLKTRLDRIEKMVTGTVQTASTSAAQITNATQTVELGAAASLEQNSPNPFPNTTIITCYLPVNNGNAYLNFYSQGGAILKTVKVTGTGKNIITIKASELASGTYRYVLTVDGKIIDSKTMIIAK